MKSLLALCLVASTNASSSNMIFPEEDMDTEAIAGMYDNLYDQGTRYAMNELLEGTWERVGYFKYYPSARGWVNSPDRTITVSRTENGDLFVSTYKKICHEIGPGLCYYNWSDAHPTEREYLMYSAKHKHLQVLSPEDGENNGNGYEPLRIFQRK